jgi:hypothetical protein
MRAENFQHPNTLKSPTKINESQKMPTPKRVVLNANSSSFKSEDIHKHCQKSTGISGNKLKQYWLYKKRL